VVRPSLRREMAQKAVVERGMPIKWACLAFIISETCYRYEAKLNSENDEIADWLIRLTENNRTWGFGLCYLYLSNIKKLWLESQTCLPDLQGTGAKPTH
jgi:putative transposase